MVETSLRSGDRKRTPRPPRRSVRETGAAPQFNLQKLVRFPTGGQAERRLRCKPVERCPRPPSTTGPATSARRSAASRSASRAAASSPSAATRTTRCRAATSAPRRWRCRTCESDPDRLRQPLRRGDDGGWQRGRVGGGARRDRCAHAPHPGASTAATRWASTSATPTSTTRGSILYLRPFLRGARQPQPLLGELGRPEPAPPGGDADVRPPVPAAGARPRPHAVPAGARRQPARLQRQHDDGAGDARPPEGAARARRQAGGRRPAAHRDGARRRPPPLHRAGHRRAASCSRCCTCCSTRGWRGRGGSPRSRDGLATLRAVAADFPPERVAARDRHRRGRRSASWRASSPPPRPAVCYGRLGVSVQEFGGLCQWLVNVVNVVTGNLDRAGRRDVPAAGDRRAGAAPAAATGGAGRAACAGCRSSRRAARGDARRGDRRRRGRGRSARSSPSPATRCSRRPTARGSSGRCPASSSWCRSTPTSTRRRATPTSSCRTTPPLERDHYDVIFHALAVRNTARYSAPLLRAEPGRAPRLGGARRRWRGGSTAGRWLGAAAAARCVAALGPRRQLDLALRSGAYGAGFRPLRARA